jgi:hypothetical protein
LSVDQLTGWAGGTSLLDIQVKTSVWESRKGFGQRGDLVPFPSVGVACPAVAREQVTGVKLL